MLDLHDLNFKQFHSPTHGLLEFDEVLEKLVDYIELGPGLQYEFIIGTDSMPGPNAEAEFVSAIVVHRKNSGGIYFWSKRHEAHLHTLRDRIFLEAMHSLKLAEQFLEKLRAKNIVDYNFSIHVDVGPNGKTKPLVQEIVGMIRGSGFNVKTKPESYGASSVADRHT
jgi:predicted RNase H-related nuclease YkuK (DUF458 family)